MLSCRSSSRSAFWKAAQRQQRGTSTRTYPLVSWCRLPSPVRDLVSLTDVVALSPDGQQSTYVEFSRIASQAPARASASATVSPSRRQSSRWRSCTGASPSGTDSASTPFAETVGLTSPQRATSTAGAEWFGGIHSGWMRRSTRRGSLSSWAPGSPYQSRAAAGSFQRSACRRNRRAW